MLKLFFLLILLSSLSLPLVQACRRTLPSMKASSTSSLPISAGTFQRALQERNLSLKRRPASILQLNIGLFCNQACSHCHVESSPLRTEKMSHEVAEQCVRILDRSPSVHTLDLTGGAPELNPEFRWLVEQGRKRNLKVIDRCNLTVLLERGQEDLAAFLARNQVNVVASLPCYSEKNVNQQRGSGVFDNSIQALRMLNDLGYGRPDSGLELDLVYNPNGAFLPPGQQKLEQDYKLRLKQDFNIDFNRLYTITNMPIKRFAEHLYRKGDLDAYMQLLVQSFNPSTVEGVMCRDTLSVSWEGSLFDCDFNQQLNMRMVKPMTVFDISSVDELVDVGISVDNHCFGCTAGAGSSCLGSLE